MQTTTELMDAARAELGVPSDYALAKAMNIDRAVVSKWRNGGTVGDENALALADILDLDPLYVMAVCHGEREKKENVRRTWARLARLAKKGIAASYITVLGFGLMPGTSGDAVAAGIDRVSLSNHYTHTFWAWLQRLARSLVKNRPTQKELCHA